ncbi:uncharacterized protein LTR77_003215 [Saxophila tyrrhenica]|uniref:Aminoglycoside phosphotransferase domain-containing protein n=1 Tax=Saxophila tyrrhenica TaxID=1690608 RepID=A0AAV9PLE9_9PEZI|nr:hypothetical protein LTR77_003215 [Saxophila tyrrhenica]
MAIGKTAMASSTPSSPDRNAIQRTAAAALQSKSVTVEKLDGYTFRTYRLRTSERFFYVLRCRPSFNIRLLRHEEGWIETEAGTLQSIGGRADIFTPRLIKYQNTTLHIGSFYLITGPFTGSILADVEPTLSTHALASIDKSLGQYVRRLSMMPGEVFGPVRQSQGFPGFRSWAKAFAFLLESIMRDGEDALISLPYDHVRDLVRRHRSSLEKITQPKLVLLELSADRNVVVDVKAEQVTGLLDYSTAIWGDPFMSDCFYKPTASFAEGFGKLPNQSADERIRQYLYVVYHSMLAIVRQFYRPSEDENEMQARRDFTTAVRQLSGQ